MLRSINPREASLVDRASGMRVRFRLGGDTFPPQIYYKIFTRAALCDVGAFAPRVCRCVGVCAVGPTVVGLYARPTDRRGCDVVVPARMLRYGRTTHVCEG